MSILESRFVVLSSAGSCHAIVAAAGDIDTNSSPALNQVLDAVLRDRPKTLTVDMSDVSFIDSRGLTALVGAFTKAQTIGTAFRVWGPSPMVVQLLRITKLAQLFPVSRGSDPPAPTPPVSNN